MTQEEFDKLFHERNIVEVFGYTLVGLRMLIDDYPEDVSIDSNRDIKGIELKSLVQAKELAEKRFIEIIKEKNYL